MSTGISIQNRMDNSLVPVDEDHGVWDGELLDREKDCGLWDVENLNSQNFVKNFTISNPERFNNI